MTPMVIAGLGLLCMFLLILLRVPVAIAMAAIGVVGFGLLAGWPAAIGLLSTEFMNKFSSPDMAIVPMFLLMGSLATVAGLSSDIYRFANALIGHIRGGLAMATVLGCGLFGAVCGSTTATTATFVRVAMPEMLSRGYGRALTVGTIAAGGGLGMLVPPSINMVIYAVMAEQFIIELFMAAFLPAAICIILFCLTVAVVVRLDAKAGPAGRRESAAVVWAMAKRAWVVLLLLIVVLGGIYTGIFTVNEAAAIGCFFTLIAAIARRAINRKTILELLRDTVISSCMVYMILIGASVFSYFVTITHVPQALISAITELEVPHWAFFLILMIVYIILGSIFDCMAAMLITLPLVMPIIVDMGYSLVWWGIVNMAIINIGQISPPIGLSIFVVQGLTGTDVATLYRGVFPYVVSSIIFLIVVLAFPWLSLVVPSILMN